MHFSTIVAVAALSSLGVTYAAPFSNPRAEIVHHKGSYQVVNVDGESTTSTTSAAPQIETVTETIQSVTTAPAVAVTITVTATPSSKATPSSTPHSHLAPPPGASFFPPPNANTGFFRRSWMASDGLLQFPRGFDSSTASVSATTTSSAIMTPSLAAI